MTRGKILGALALSMLSLCAFGAANASAAGLTAYTCVEGTKGTETYKDTHCTEDDPTNKSNFETKAIPPNTTTAGTSTQAKTGVTSGTDVASVLSATVGGVPYKFSCAEVMSEGGWGENREEGGVMKVVGEGVAHYTNCTVLQPQTTCKVSSGGAAPAGTIQTAKLKAESNTMAEAPKHTGKYTPAVGTTFVTLKITECKTAAFNAELPVTGSAVGSVPEARHSHVTFEGTAGGELKIAGQTANYSATTHATMEGTDRTIGGST